MSRSRLDVAKRRIEEGDFCRTDREKATPYYTAAIANALVYLIELLEDRVNEVEDRDSP